MGGSFCPPEKEKCPDHDKVMDNILDGASCKCGEIADRLIETKGLSPEYRCNFIIACTLDVLKRTKLHNEVTKALEKARKMGWL